MFPSDSAPCDPILAAAQDPGHVQHHFSLGQVLATVMIGAADALTAYSDPAKIPASIADFVRGFLTVWTAETKNTS